MAVPFLQMDGPITPVLRLMAAWHAKHSEVEVEDLLQEAWLHIHLRPHRPMKLVAHTAMHNAVERDRVWRKYAANYTRPDNSRDYDPLELLDLPVYLSRLSTEQRMVVEMFYYDELSVASIAGRCGMSTSGINRRLRLAIMAMRGSDIEVRQTGRYSRSRKHTSAGYRKLSKYYR